MAPKDRSRQFCKILSAPVTALAILGVHALQIPHPMAVLLIPVMFFAFAGGYAGGVISGALTIAYAAHFFSAPGQLFVNSARGAAEVLMIAALAGAIVLLVGRLKSRSEKDGEKESRLNENFLKLLSNMDVQILVTEPGTDHILFANTKRNSSSSIDHDPPGQPCWTVYPGLDRPCQSCPPQQVYDHQDSPNERESCH